jgi:hypothetical protein
VSSPLQACARLFLPFAPPVLPGQRSAKPDSSDSRKQCGSLRPMFRKCAPNPLAPRECTVLYLGAGRRPPCFFQRFRLPGAEQIRVVSTRHPIASVNGSQLQFWADVVAGHFKVVTTRHSLRPFIGGPALRELWRNGLGDRLKIRPRVRTARLSSSRNESFRYPLGKQIICRASEFR